MSTTPLVIRTQFEIASLQAGMQQSAAAVEAGTARMRAAFQEVAPATEYSITEARHAIHGLGEEIGVRVPRFVQSFIARIGGVGPLLAAAFTPVAIIGVVDVLKDASEKVIEFYQNTYNLKSAFEALGTVTKTLEEDQIELSNALVVGQIRLAGLTGGSIVEAKARVSALGEEIVNLGKLVDKSGKSFENLSISAKAHLGEFLRPTLAKDLEEILGRVGREIQFLQRLQLNTEEGTTEYKNQQVALEALSGFYDTLALKVERYNQELAAGNAEAVKAQQAEAEKRARKEEEAAQRAQRAWHQAVIAELDDAERLAKEETRLKEETAKENAEFDKNVEAEIKRVDAEIERSKERSLALAVETQNKELRETEAAVKKAEQIYKQTYQRIANDVNTNAIQMLNGQESFGRGMQKIWTGIVDSALTGVLKIGEKWVEQHVVMAAVSKLFHVQEAVDAITQAKATGVAQVGLAGAGGTASMAAAPFPFDLGAPAFGAEMATIAASYMAFAKGGIVPHDTPALLHANEMVLPSHISHSIQRAADTGTMGKGGHTFNYSPTINGGAIDAGTLKQLHGHFMKIATRELRRRGLG